MPALLEMIEDMGSQEWLTLLGQLWTGMDNVSPCSGDLFDAILEKVMDPESVIPELISDEERMAFNSLPEQITIYRGCGTRNTFGFSWSLDRQIASKFPFMVRYWADKPKLLMATINKSRAAALKLDRGEQEIILFDYLDEPSIRWAEEELLTPRL